MLTLIENYTGNVNVNGIEYSSVNGAILALKHYTGNVVVKIPKRTGAVEAPVAKVVTAPISTRSDADVIYQIKVRQYMTKPPTLDFNFHGQWNGGNPMPMRIMVGRKLKETKGMVMMELWGDIVAESMSMCMKCGKMLTNPVSKYFGIGPECGSHNYVNPFNTEEELEEAIHKMRLELNQVRWTGWIIKSSIEQEFILEA